VKKITIIIEKLIIHKWLTLALLLMLALTLRTIKPFLTDRIVNDGVLYVRMANDISNGNIKDAFARHHGVIPPLYPLLMGHGVKVGMNAEVSGVIISIISGIGLIIAIFMITEVIFGIKPALFAAFLATFNPDLIEISSVVLRDALFLSLFFWAFYFVLKALENTTWNLWHWVFAGMLTLLAAATRGEGIELFIIIAVALLVEIFLLLKNHTFTWEQGAKWSVGLLCFTLMYIATAIPFIHILAGTKTKWGIMDSRVKRFYSYSNYTKATGRLKRQGK
jgi:4-amino-4-deoxy-L-arabinose transferase-like glycosyltransferase